MRAGHDWDHHGLLVGDSFPCAPQCADRRIPIEERGKWAKPPVPLHPMIIKVQQNRQVLEVQEVLESCCLVQHTHCSFSGACPLDR